MTATVAGTQTHIESDGRGVAVSLTTAVAKGAVAYADGWLGLAGADGASGDTVALAVDGREYQFRVPAGLAVTKGQIVYIDLALVTGHYPDDEAYGTNDVWGSVALFKATSDKDAANIATGVLLSGLWRANTAWIAPAWHVDGSGYAYATPTLGSELLTNGAFASDTAWAKGAGWTIAGGVGVGTAATGTLSQAVATSGTDYVLAFDVTAYTSGGLRTQNGGTQQGPYTAIGSYVASGRANGANIGFDVATNFTGTVDNASAKAVTGPAHAAIRGQPDRIGARLVAWVYNQSFRLRWGIDDLDSPQNYIEIRAFTNPTGASVAVIASKAVAGTATTLIGSTSIAFVANALLEIRRTAATTFQFCIGSEVGADGSGQTVLNQYARTVIENHRVVVR